MNLPSTLSKLSHSTKALETLGKLQNDLGISTDKLTAKQANQMMVKAGLDAATRRQILTDSGLIAVQGKATVSTFSLTAAFDGLKIAIMTNPIGAAITAATIALTAFSVISTKVNHAQQQMRMEAEQSARAYADHNKSLDDAKKKITELKDALDSGNLSQADAYQKRKELFGIQSDLIETYGRESVAINAVTAAINGQVDALDALSEREYNSFLTDHNKAIEDAKKVRQELQKTTIYSHLDERILAQLTKFEGLQINTDPTGYSTLIFDETLENKIKMLEQISGELRIIQQTADESDISAITHLLNMIGQKTTAIKSTLNETEAVYKQYIDGMIMHDVRYSRMRADVLRAMVDYQEALFSGDDEAVANAEKAMIEVRNRMLEATQDDAHARYAMENILAPMKAVIANTEFKLNFTANTDGIADEVTNALSKLDGLDDQGILALSTGIGETQEQLDGYQELLGVAEKYDMSIQNLIDTLINLGLVQGEVFDEYLPRVAIGSLEDLNKELDRLKSVYSTVSKALEELNENNYISISTYQELLSASAKYLGHLVDENGQLTLTKDSLDELTKARIDDLAIQQAQQLVDMAARYQGDADAMERLAGTYKEAANDYWDLIDAQIADLDAAPHVIASLQAQIIAIRELGEATKDGVGKGLTSSVDYNKATTDVEKYLEAYRSATNEVMKSHWAKKAEESLGIVEKGLQKGILSFNEYKEAQDALDSTIFERVNKTFSTLEGEANKVSAAFRELKENKQLTQKTANDLIEAGYASILVIDEETGAITLSADAYKGLKTARLNDAIAAASINREKIISDLEKEKNKVEQLSGAYIKSANVMHVAMRLFWNARVAQGEAALDEAESQLAVLKGLQGELDNIVAGTYGDKSKDRTSSTGADYDAKYPREFLAEVEKINSAISITNKELDIMDAKQVSLIEKLQKLNELEDLHRIKLEEQNIAMDKMVEKRDEIISQLAGYSFDPTASEDDKAAIYNALGKEAKQQVKALDKDYQDLYKSISKLDEDRIQTELDIIRHKDRTINAIKAQYEAERKILEVALDRAQAAYDYDKEIALYKEYQDSLMAEREHYLQLGLALDDERIAEAEKKWRDYSRQIVKVIGEAYDYEREKFDRIDRRIEFKMSIVDESDVAKKAELLNQQYENRNKKLSVIEYQLQDLYARTTEAEQATREFISERDKLLKSYEDEIKAIKAIYDAKKALADKEIQMVRDLNKKVMDVIKQRYQDELDQMQKVADEKKKKLEEQKKNIQDESKKQIEAIDDELKMWQKLWKAEDDELKKKERDKRRQQDIDDISEIQKQINKLMIAANTGDAEAYKHRPFDVNPIAQGCVA